MVKPQPESLLAGMKPRRFGLRKSIRPARKFFLEGVQLAQQSPNLTPSNRMRQRRPPKRCRLGCIPLSNIPDAFLGMRIDGTRSFLGIVAH